MLNKSGTRAIQDAHARLKEETEKKAGHLTKQGQRGKGKASAFRFQFHSLKSLHHEDVLCNKAGASPLQQPGISTCTTYKKDGRIHHIPASCQESAPVRPWRGREKRKTGVQEEAHRPRRPGNLLKPHAPGWMNG